VPNYKDKIASLAPPSFDDIRRIALSEISHYSDTEHTHLWKELKHGTALIKTHEQLCAYLRSFGIMHKAKLVDSIKQLPNELINQPFEVIDWGCGQAIGTVNLFDILNEEGKGSNIKKVTLIEPSQAALERGKLHVSAYLKNQNELVTISKFFEAIEPSQITSGSGLPVLHIFSNILDIPQIDLKDLATKIDKSVVVDNYIVSVGPLNATNHRIDAFYNYFQVPVIYDKEDSSFSIGNNKTKTYKAKIYKLEFNAEGNLIPIEFYPSVQFHSTYRLDCINDVHIKSNNTDLSNITKNLNVFETSTPFDIGANVYDDVHPILAVLNNLITRGSPTKASPFIENNFQKAFNYSSGFEKYGTFSYPIKKEVDYEKTILWYNSLSSKEEDIDYTEIDKEQLQLIFTPIAIARVQKIIIEAVMTGKLNIDSTQWKILVEEKDVPCSAIAFTDLAQMFNNLTALSDEYQNLKFPNIQLDIIGNETFLNSRLHLKNNVIQKAKPTHLKIEYDLVIDISIFETSNIQKESFSKFKCKNDCYFNIRSAKEIKSERNIYTTDRVRYRKLVLTNGQGVYSDDPETKKLLEYFLQLIFRKESFRAGQLPILNRALQNKSVIGLLPTGGGKSLTYQLAAMLQPGVTLIVDPLRSLMKDQYDGLITAGIDSCGYIMSAKTTEEREYQKVIERKMEQSKLLFIFLSPERLAIYKFREKLKNMHELNVYFSYGVIDEVHCVSEWGHDFRFSYLHLGRNLYNYVRSKNSIISLFGLTATASFDVLADVERELSGNGAFPLDSETIVRYENSNRLELQYKIEKVNVEFQNEYEVLKKSKYATPQKLAKYDFFINNKLPFPLKVSDKWGFYDAKQDFLKEYIKAIPKYINDIQTTNSIEYIKHSFVERQGNSEGSEDELETNISRDYFSKQEEYEQAGIIFCPHKNGTGISVQKNKNSLINMVPDVGTFSGGDDNGNNSMQNLELFRTNKQPLMIATKAFGMGIDKPNVRFTINLNYSSSLESFVQEAGRGGRDRKIALSVIFLSDYKLARISRKYQSNDFPLGSLKGHWFKTEDLQKILKQYSLDIDNQFINYLTPENDLVRLFCKEGTQHKYFGFNSCSDTNCRMFTKCKLRKTEKEMEGWIYKEDLTDLLQSKDLSIDKKYIEYQNADYETVMYFYNKSFKGEVIEKMSMYNILSIEPTDIFYGDDSELKPKKVKTVLGFLTTLINSNEEEEIVSFVKYIKPNIAMGIEGTETDLAKAIYRMTCIELIEDFTQDYKNNRYRIVSKRKKEGAYYNGLERFLLRYYSIDRAQEEIKKVHAIYVTSESNIEKEIFQCLNYLTTFVYDKISTKRKRAIDDMRTFCITGANDTKDWKITNEELKDFIYYYFNSKYAKSDYIADNGEEYSITNDTDGGKISSERLLFKYLKVIDKKVEYGTSIDNVKHLQGAVRIIRRSLTDSNPTLSLLNSFCIFFLGTNNNENLEKEVIESYKEGMIEFAKREQKLINFWHLFEEYNKILKPFSDNKLKELKDEITIKIHNNKFKNIAIKYIE